MNKQEAQQKLDHNMHITTDATGDTTKGPSPVDIGSVLVEAITPRDVYLVHVCIRRGRVNEPRARELAWNAVCDVNRASPEWVWTEGVYAETVDEA